MNNPYVPSKSFTWIFLISLLVCLKTEAASVSIQLSGTNATGGLNIVGFDNEINKPDAPASNDFVSSSDGNSSSHGFAFFQYKYDDNNPDAFNDYAPLWSIIASTHTVADQSYYESLLTKAGAVAYENLTLSTQVLHPSPGNFNLGDITYDSSLLTGFGTETLAISDFSLSVDRDDFDFNVLNTDTTPGTWVGFPYYYWGLDNAYTLTVDNLTGAGLSFDEGVLVSMDFMGDAKVTAFGQDWEGTFTASGLDVTYDVNDANSISGFGDLNIIMDRSGTVIPEPNSLLLLLGGVAFLMIYRHWKSLLKSL